ncbi:MAG: hypothetical protein AAGA48_41080 [Myxococcota bacterium]
MADLFDALFSAKPDVRAAALADLPSADPAEVDAIFLGLVANGVEGFRWHDRFRSTPFVRDRIHLRRYLNVILGYAPARCKVLEWGAKKLTNLVIGGSQSAPVHLDSSFAFDRFEAAIFLGIRHATVDAPPALATLPTLRSVRLWDVRTRTPGVLRLAKGVSTLRLVDVPGGVEGLEGPSLEVVQVLRGRLDPKALKGLEMLSGLDLDGQDELDITALPKLPALSSLTLSGCSTVRDCAGLSRQPALRQVGLHDLPGLTSLEGLPKRLSLLKLSHVPNLSSLAHLPELPDMRAFEINGADRLTDVSQLVGALPQAEQVGLRGLKRKVEIASLAGLEAMTVLDLRDSSGIGKVADAMSPFLNHGSLRAILLRDTGIDRSAIPPRERWRFSWARHPNIDEMVGRTPPDRKTWDGLKGEGRTILAKIRKLVRSPDIDVIEQGLELLTIVDDPHVYDALLAGADYRQVRLSSRLNRRPWRLGSRRFTGPTRSYVLHRLLAEAPEDSAYATALRERIHTLDFVEPHYPAQPHPLDLSSLARLPNLTSLAFARFGPFTLVDEDEPGTIPRLDTLEIHHPQGVVPAAWLAAQTAVRQVRLLGEHAGSRDLSFARSMANLDVLEISQQSQLDVTQLAGSRLKELSITSCGSITSLDGLPDGIESVRVSWCWQLTDIQALLDLPSLKSFRRYGCAIPDEQLALLEARGVTILK